ncbi:MAG: hypothetical protein ACLSCV_08395 [Acutalibacteraceae bacterium]
MAVITATASNGKSSACVVTVRAKTAYDAPYDKEAIYADMVAYGMGKGFTLDTVLSADSAEYFEEYTEMAGIRMHRNHFGANVLG